jgi:transmembrane sensor
MIDLTTRVERAGRRVKPVWSAERVEATVRAVRLRQRQRRARAALARVGAAVVATAAALILLFVWRPWSPPSASPLAPSALAVAAPASPVRRGEPSVVPLDGKSTLVWKDTAPEHVVVAVDRGGARCEASVPGTGGVRIEGGPVAVLANDAAFVAERVAGDRLRVTVERGRVRVLWALREEDLVAGQSDTFPRLDDGARAASASAAAEPPRSPTPRSPSSSAPAGSSAAAGASAPVANGWRELARQGSYDEAYEHLRREGGPKDEVNDLLLAADVARLGHHPADAVAPLRQVEQAHASDPRASLAAFTLGRVLLTQLGQPAAAADAFARARALSPGGALDEDALAREVEARSRAGDASAARRLADEYLQRFPTGSRAASVRRFGGIE